MWPRETWRDWLGYAAIVVIGVWLVLAVIFAAASVLAPAVFMVFVGGPLCAIALACGLSGGGGR